MALIHGMPHLLDTLSEQLTANYADVSKTNHERMMLNASTLGGLYAATYTMLTTLVDGKDANPNLKEYADLAAAAFQQHHADTGVPLPPPFVSPSTPDDEPTSIKSKTTVDKALMELIKDVRILKKQNAGISKLNNDVGTLSRQVQTLLDRPPPRPPRLNPPPPPTVAPAPAPLTYAQVAATAAPAPPTTTAPAPQASGKTTPKKAPSSGRPSPPPPKVYAKDPTLVFTANPYIPAAKRKSGAALTTAVRDFFAKLPTTKRLLVRSAVFNTKGRIVCTFTNRPGSTEGMAVESALDSHAGALCAHLAPICYTGTMTVPPVLTATRVRPRSTLRISRVPTRDTTLPKGQRTTYTQEALLAEFNSNPILSDLQYIVPPHYTAQSDALEKENLEICPVIFTFADREKGEIRAKLLKKPTVWLFGLRFRLSIPPMRPGFSQCDRCQALGHSSRGCKAPITCAYCAGPHATKYHRSKCPTCAQEAVPAGTPCSHPRLCANCQGTHRSTSVKCPLRRKYGPSPNDDESDSDSDSADDTMEQGE